jgi:hypothetical protein
MDEFTSCCDDPRAGSARPKVDVHWRSISIDGFHWPEPILKKRRRNSR